MKLALLTLVSAGLWAGVAAAQTVPACEALTKAYALHEDRLAMHLANMAPEQPFPAAGYTAAQAQIEASLLNATLQLMAANRCPAPTRPVNTDAYLRSIKECLDTGGQADSVRIAKCTRSKWASDPN